MVVLDKISNNDGGIDLIPMLSRDKMICKQNEDELKIIRVILNKELIQNLNSQRVFYFLIVGVMKHVGES